jgi:hypothetical protein
VTRFCEIRYSREFERIEKRADVKGAHIERARTGVKLNVTAEYEKNDKRA